MTGKGRREGTAPREQKPETAEPTRPELGRMDDRGTETGRRRELYAASIDRASGPQDLPAALVREHVGWMRDTENRARKTEGAYGPHAVTDHLNVETEKLDARLTDQGRKHATMFTSEAALVLTEMVARRRCDAEQRLRETPRIDRRGQDVRPFPIADALGPDWRDHVSGRSRRADGTIVDTVFPDDTEVFARWTRGADGRWRAQTCYPKIP